MIIKEFENTGYFVTSDGDVFKKNKEGLLLPITKRKVNEKDTVAIKTKEYNSSISVDSLMARTFFNLKGKKRYTVHHIDGDNTNDTLINLSVDGVLNDYDKILAKAKKCLKSPKMRQLSNSEKALRGTIELLLEENNELEGKIKEYERRINEYDRVISSIKYRGLFGKLRKKIDERKLAKLIEREIKNENN